MPHLVILGRPSGLAGDDLSIFLCLGLVFKLIQTGLLIPLFRVVHKAHLLPVDPALDCENHTAEELERDGHWLVTYWSLSAALVVAAMVLNYIMMRVSRRGSPSEPEKRSALSQLCAFNLIAVTLLRVLVVASGIVSQVAVSNICSCQSSTNGDDGMATKSSSSSSTATAVSIDPIYTTMATNWNTSCESEEYMTAVTLFRGLFVTHAMEASFALFFYVWRFFDIFKPMARLFRRRQAPTSDGGSSWTSFCRMCCTCTSLFTCCLFGGLDAAFADFVDLSTTLEDFFDSGGTLDVTISDILAGILMVYREQLEEREECRQMFRRLGGHSKSQQFTEAMASMKQQAAHYHAPELEIPSNDMPDQPWHGRGFAVDLEADGNQGSEGSRLRQQVFETMILRRHRISLENEFEPQPRFVLDPAFEEDRTAIVEGAHYIKLALAMYGHKLYIVNRAATGSAFLCAKSLMCSTYSCSERRQLGDIACGCYKNAFLEQAGLEADDVLYATFRAGIVRRPYCIVVDRPRKALVVVIRGTLSLEDLVADFTIRPLSLDEGRERYGYEFEGEYVHSGMHASAEWLFNDIEVNGILSGSLLGEKATYKGFTLYVIGHSLGAGVATILSLMLRSKYATHRCLAFEPPGCVFSEGAARKLDATSYVYNHDIVPRLSLHSLVNLRKDILLMLARLKVPKDSVVLPKPLRFQRNRASTLPSKDMLHSLDEIPESRVMLQLKEFGSYAESRRQDRGQVFDVQLYPPGKIVHIFKSKGESRSLLEFTRKWEQEKTIHTAVWADNGDFAEIELTSSFLTDHDPMHISTQINRLVAAFKAPA